MEKLKVIFRKIDGEILAFFPEQTANYGKIVAFEYLGKVPCGGGLYGGHFEVAIDYYYSTEKANPEEYAEALEMLRKYVYDDVQLVVRQRINYRDLNNHTWRR